MTLSKGNYFCKKCEITFKAEIRKVQRPRKACPKCHRICDLAVSKKMDVSSHGEQSPTSSHNINHDQSSARIDVSPNYIDDPDELLMNVAIRELNRPKPDPRWASILINCKKENITTKSEVLEQFKQLPTQALVNLLSKSLQEE